MDIPPVTSQSANRDPRLLVKARELEATFLSEMLSHSGLTEMQGSFSGGQGEAQFSSFLRQEQARLMVESGGIGLAEMIFKAMSGNENGRS